MRRSVVVTGTTMNMDMVAPQRRSHIVVNARTIDDRAKGVDFVGLTEMGPLWYRGAVREVLTGYDHHMPTKSKVWGTSETLSWMKDSGWEHHSSMVIPLCKSVRVGRKVISDSRQLVADRFLDEFGNPLIVGDFHFPPPGSWAGPAGVEASKQAIHEEILPAIHRFLRARSAPVLLMGDPNLNGPFLGQSVARLIVPGTIKPRMCSYVGGGSTDRAVFIDGATSRWSQINGSRYHAKYIDHSSGALKFHGTLTYS